MKFDLGVFAETFLSMKDSRAVVEKNIFLGVVKGEIVEICPWKKSLRSKCKKFIDGKGQVCLPGMVNGHSHLPMTLFRGLEDDVPFHVWLFERILPLEGKMVSKDFVKVGTELAALECIRFGVTTVNEMYFYAAETAAALDRAGMRGIVSQTVAKFPLPEDKDLGTDKFKVFRDAKKKFSKSNRIEIGLAPHAPYSCDDALLRKVLEVADETNSPIHIHVSETAKEVEDSKKEFGITPVERLQKLGLLRSRTLCAHCVHLDDVDIEIFKKSGASVLYNPDSNMKLASGIAPVAEYLKEGIPVSLGTDGSASNNDLSIFGAMDIGTKLQKLAFQDSTAMTAEQALVAATIGGAKALGLGDKVGSLEVGKRADFIFVDFQFPHLQPVHNPVSHLVYAAQGLEVDTVVCDGKLLMEKKKFKTLNEKSVYKKATAWRNKIAKELGQLKK